MSYDSDKLNATTIWDTSLVGTHYSNAYNIRYRQQSELCNGELANNGLSNSAILYKERDIQNKDLNALIEFVDYLNTQNMDIEQQLNMGVRYLEVPICYQNDMFYTSNLYLSDSFKQIARQVKVFLRRNSKEVVIIDLDNNLYSNNGLMTDHELELLHGVLVDAFDNALIPSTDMNKPIQEWLIDHKRVIILTSNSYLARYPDIWNKSQINHLELSHTPTIKKLTTLEMMFESMNQHAQLNNGTHQHAFNIIPLYEQARTTNTPHQEYEDSDLDQQLVLNYLNTHLTNQNVILVGDKTNLYQISDIVSRQKLKTPTQEIHKPIIESKTAESNDLLSN